VPEFFPSADNYANMKELIEVAKIYNQRTGRLSLVDSSYDKITVYESFMVNEIKFNTRLNENFKGALDGSVSDLVQALVKDYQYNQRQIALYYVDCWFVQCTDQVYQMQRFIEKMDATAPIYFLIDESPNFVTRSTLTRD
jgi:hypothetical protein